MNRTNGLPLARTVTSSFLAVVSEPYQFDWPAASKRFRDHYFMTRKFRATKVVSASGRTRRPVLFAGNDQAIRTSHDGLDAVL